jgi:acyl-CoA synthetase (AMP-forming)/AMP-acid ligase II
MSSGRVSGEPETVVDVLRSAASESPDAEAFVDGEARISFGGLDVAADSVASLFASAGVRKGDIVALLLRSSIGYAVCYHAAVRLGAVTSGVNPRLGPNEKAHIFGRLRPAVTVFEGGDDLSASSERSIAREEISQVISEALSGKGAPAPALPRLRPSDPVAVVWTGGSTGIPKGALFDHDSLRAVAAGTDVLSSPGDRRLSPLPFAHVGYMTRAWDEISKRITTVITPTPWTAAEAIALMAKESVTVGQGVPTQWALVLAHPDLEGADLSAMRVAGTGAARVPPGLVRAMRERLGCPVVVRYTSTETSLGTGTKLEDPDEVVVTTVGAPVPGVELEIVDEDDARPVAETEVGAVRMRSAAQMLGYVASGAAIDESATGAVRNSEGWITTGDLGWIGADGNLRLVGRRTEMLIRGGYNVYPAEVEAVLGVHPAVKQVSVIGAPDEVLGEIIVAFVVADETASPDLEGLRAHCRRSLADYKVPDRLELISELPTTPLGKVDTRALKALASSEHEGARR